MNKQITEKPNSEHITLHCKNCGNMWNYTGSNAYYATCPSCLRKVPVPKTPYTEEDVHNFFKEMIIKAVSTWANNKVKESKMDGAEGFWIDVADRMTEMAKDNPQLARELGEIAHKYYKENNER